MRSCSVGGRRKKCISKRNNQVRSFRCHKSYAGAIQKVSRVIIEVTMLQKCNFVDESLNCHSTLPTPSGPIIPCLQERLIRKTSSMPTSTWCEHGCTEKKPVSQNNCNAAFDERPETFCCRVSYKSPSGNDHINITLRSKLRTTPFHFSSGSVLTRRTPAVRHLEVPISAR